MAEVNPTLGPWACTSSGRVLERDGKLDTRPGSSFPGDWPSWTRYLPPYSDNEDPASVQGHAMRDGPPAGGGRRSEEGAPFHRDPYNQGKGIVVGTTQPSLGEFQDVSRLGGRRLLPLEFGDRGLR